MERKAKSFPKHDTTMYIENTPLIVPNHHAHQLGIKAAAVPTHLQGIGLGQAKLPF